MKKTTAIRDIKVIEEELTKNGAGVLSFISEPEKIYQAASPFIYLDKNIYLFADAENEILHNIEFNTPVVFTITRTEIKKVQGFRTVSVTVFGLTKIVDDRKLKDEIKKIFEEKYNFSLAKFKSADKIIMINTEEIQAYKVKGE
jgi:nitroimidazol reductase NimA-like FMN-containing flavoprotein (pyridoxamine 5'-phosphate oxidase superfamily)